jgi:hypothetical protein
MNTAGGLAQPSQASSHFPLEPISGSTLFELEVARREELRRQGTLRTGCKEIDEQVLVHGFERGCVVGVSAEEVDTGLLVSTMRSLGPRWQGDDGLWQIPVGHIANGYGGKGFLAKS